MTEKEFQVETGLVIEKCINCGILFAMPSELNRKRRRDHKNIYCPNGHAQYYPQLSEEEKLKSRLHYCSIRNDELEKSLKLTDYRLRYYKGRAKKAKAINP